MTEKSYQDAVQVLKDRIGSQWDGLEQDGRDEMVAILRDQLGYDNRAANDAIDLMIQSGQLRYHRIDPQGAGDADVPAAAVLPLGGVAGSQSGFAGTGAGAPLVAGAFRSGYWQIGEGDAAPPGRAGQVTPS